jgi:hypothetical protein
MKSFKTALPKKDLAPLLHWPRAPPPAAPRPPALGPAMASHDVAFVHRALDSWLASTSTSVSPEDPNPDAVFTPTEAQAKQAVHFSHRLELARVTCGGVEERLLELRQRLETTNRGVRRAECEERVALRRLRFAKHGGSSNLADLPMGDDAGAFRSVFDARGDVLAKLIRHAAESPERFHKLVGGLEKRKTLVTDQLLKHIS